MKEGDRIVDEIRYIAASLVGAGIDRDSLNEALQSHPHFIACDAGTMDAGPFSLGSGHPAPTLLILVMKLSKSDTLYRPLASQRNGNVW